MTPPNPFDRRDFLKNSAALSAAFAGLTSEGARLKAADEEAADTGHVRSRRPVLAQPMAGGAALLLRSHRLEVEADQSS